MHIYASHLLATWLQDATHGVNALLSGVPRIGSDTLPPNVTLREATRNKETTRGLAPKTALPALQIMRTQRPLVRSAPSVQPYPVDASLTMTIEYHAEKDLDSAKALRDTEYTMLAVERSLTRLFSGQVAAGTTLRQTVATDYATQFMHAEATEWDSGYESDGDTVVTGVMHITLRARSLFAQT